MGAGGEEIVSIVAFMNRPRERPMQYPNDLRRCLTVLDQDSTLIAVIEMSLSSWLVAGIVPGIERQPLKKLEADKHAPLKLLHCWRDEAVKAGRKITRIAVAFEAGRDGFWLARWLRAHDIEAHVIHASSVAVPVRTPPGEDRSARYRDVKARFSRLAARRAESLQGCGDSNAGRGRCQWPTASARASLASAAGRLTG